MVQIGFIRCSHEIEEESKNFQENDSFGSLYRINSFPLTSISTDWATTLNINHLNENQSLLCEFSYTNNEFRIIDLTLDKLLKIIKFPEKIKKIGSISICDSNNFAFITDTTFYIYKDNHFKRINYADFNDGYIPLNYINILYNSNENKLFSGVLSYTKRKVNEPDYSSFFINAYDLKTMKSTLLPFKYPKQFHGNKLGIPKVLLSEFDNNLLVSFELDDNIYKIDLKTKKVTKFSCDSKISNVQKAIFPKNGNKKSKVDAIQKNSINVGGYGMAFYDKRKNKLYRLYRPGLPDKDREGNYFNSTDRGIHIIELDLKNQHKKEIQLANGQHFVPMYWSFNQFKNTLCYPNLEEHVAKKNICFYNFHCVSIYNN